MVYIIVLRLLGMTVLATDIAHTAGVATKLVLSIDAPTARTGTGDALFLDGGDVAVLRATVVDGMGHPCTSSTVSVTFAVAGGPGTMIGVGNGDPADQAVTVSTRAAYHGLVRGLVRVTMDAAGTREDRTLRWFVNVDAGKNASSSIWTGSGDVPTAITVTATALGVESASITIPVSTDLSYSVLAAAGASVGLADLGV